MIIAGHVALHIRFFALRTEVQGAIATLPLTAVPAVSVERQHLYLNHFFYELARRLHLLKQGLVAALHTNHQLHLLIESFCRLEV